MVYGTVYWTIEQGVRKGCLLSSLLFVIVAEFLACKIRQNEDIKGIDILGSALSELNVSQFADDTTIFVNSSESLIKIMEEVRNFGALAGPQVNWDNTDYANGECGENTEQPIKYL